MRHGPRARALPNPAVPALQGGAGARVLLWVKEGELYLKGKGSIFKVLALTFLLLTASSGGRSIEVSAGREAGSQDPEQGWLGAQSPCGGFITWGLTPREPLSVSKPGAPTLPVHKNPLGELGGKICGT